MLIRLRKFAAKKFAAAGVNIETASQNGLADRTISKSIKSKGRRGQADGPKFSLLFSSFLIFALVLLVSNIIDINPVQAANHLESIDIVATINDDGSMDISQYWEGYFDQHTELYIPMLASDYMTFSNFRVSDQLGDYEILDSWDIDASFADKARKAGIYKPGSGYEICFGISQYGRNKYHLTYHLDQVVASYLEADGANFRFINDQMNTGPTDGMVIIRLANGTPLTEDNARIWGFGYAGEVEFREGNIVAYSKGGLGWANHMTVMFSLEPGLIEPSRIVAGPFEEVKDQAFLGSDYGTDGSQAESFVDRFIYAIMGLMVAFYFFIFFGMQRVAKWVWGRPARQIYEEYGYYRDIPNQGNISATYLLANGFHFCPEESILAVGMMRLVDMGYLIPKRDEKLNFLMMTREKLEFSLTDKDPALLTYSDQLLFYIIQTAAGPDAILQEKELKKYSRANDRIIRTYMDQVESDGWKYLRDQGALVKALGSLRLKNLTNQGRAEVGQAIGMKKYLEDFSLIAERGLSEMPLWRELLLYALLFGIADQLAKELEKHYPELRAEIESYTYTMATVAGMQSSMYGGVRAAENARSSGSGGSSSSGGGGGSSGGGSGGGSR